ncbi:MAG: hypothetical protein ACOCQ1_02245 [Halanaerobiaceae bacterium]
MFKNVSNTIFNNISFQVQDNDLVLIFSENKQKLAVIKDLISGQKQPDTGLVKLTAFQKNRSKSGADFCKIVDHKCDFLSHRSIRENLYFIQNVLSLNRLQSGGNEDIEQILRFVELKVEAHKKPFQLMKHQYLRLCLARALLFAPSFLVVFNPTQGLSEINSRAAGYLLKRINNRGISVLILTSDRRLLGLNSGQKDICLKKGASFPEKN